ncbi:MAG: L-histidine N(alpha)-methyltransferase [Pseudomonadota bacterium]
MRLLTLTLSHPADTLGEVVLAGLSASPKRIPPKYFYDSEGSRLFEAICRQPEYYLTRAETALLQAEAQAIARRIGPVASMIEPGAGCCAKARLLLGPLKAAAYWPVDIDGETLAAAAGRLAAEHPALDVTAVQLDFTAVDGFAPLLPHLPAAGRRLVYYPGSSIGNAGPDEAVGMLKQFRVLAGPDGGLLIGFDLKKAAARLNAAYNDAAGVTAAFNRNLLVRLNRELGADFRPETFDHHAFYNAGAGRIEMHLVSRVRQQVTVAGVPVMFEAGESLHTENSYKYTPREFDALAAQAGFAFKDGWQDGEGLFAVHYYA